MALITEGLLTAVLDGINWQLNSVYSVAEQPKVFFFLPLEDPKATWLTQMA